MSTSPSFSLVRAARSFGQSLCALALLAGAAWAQPQRSRLPDSIRPEPTGIATGLVADSPRIVLKPVVGSSIPAVPAAIPAAVLYSTDFEAFALGGNRLAGRETWAVTDNTSGATGILDFSPISPRAAYIGFGPSADSGVSARRPINYDPVGGGRPVVEFSVDLLITDSTNGQRDDFLFLLYNSQNQLLAGIDFLNADLGVYRYDGSSFHALGTFNRGVRYRFVATIDFAANRWSATINGGTVFTNQPLTATGRALTLGSFDATWLIATQGSPGNNFMVFDNYRVSTASTDVAPVFVKQPQNITVHAGQGATFTLGATGTPPPFFQWEVSVDGGGTWSKLVYETTLNGTTYRGTSIAGQLDVTLSLSNVSFALNGARYRAIASNGIGSPATSDSATLTVIDYPGVVAAATGANATLFLRADGTLWGLGSQGSGQLGNGMESGFARFPVQVASDVVTMAAGPSHSLFVKADGSLWGMGYTLSGALGLRPESVLFVPAQLATDVVSVSAGSLHTLFIKRDGSLWAMGWRASGRLGDGEVGWFRQIPIQVAAHVVAASAGGGHSVFLKSDGTLWATGSNTHGQLGDGTRTDRLTPLSVATDVLAISAGVDHTLFVGAAGDYWAMGYNTEAMLGNLTTADQLSPVRVFPGVSAIAAGGSHNLFLRNGGELWGVGTNDYGQLGLGTTSVSERTAQRIATGVAAISARPQHSLFVKTDGTLWGMGDNSSGELGGVETRRLSPVQVASGRAVTPPLAPSGVVATVGTFDAEIRVAWNPVIGATRYEVWRGPSNAQSAATLIAANVAVPFYDDFSAPAGTTLYYWVRAANVGGASEPSVGAPGSRPLEIAATITTPPQEQTVNSGQAAVFTVAAAGTPTPTYQWQRQRVGTTGFTNLSVSEIYRGTMAATLTIITAAGTMTGDQFRCVVRSGLSSPVTSAAVLLTVLEAPVITTPATAKFIIGRAGTTTVVASGSPPATFTVPSGTLPPWATANATTGFISGTPPDATGSPFSITITATNGIGTPATQTFTLTVQPGHSADVSPADGTLNLAELTRVIELYNTSTGTVRTGRYTISAGSADGYAPDPSLTAAPIPATPHTADTNRDGRLSLTELTRVIELFNTRAGTARSGAYHPQPATEDGFAPGP